MKRLDFRFIIDPRFAEHLNVNKSTRSLGELPITVNTNWLDSYEGRFM